MFEGIFVVLIILAVLAIYFGRYKFTPPKTKPSDYRTYQHFEAVKSLFVNRSEMIFFHSLQNAIPDGLYVLSKVRLEDIIGVKSSITNTEARWKLRARVKSRHIDFLIIDKTGTPLMGIELDGDSHTADSFNADTLKNGLFKSTNLPLARVDARGDFKAAIDEILQNLNI
jgi:hypothetical protein